MAEREPKQGDKAGRERIEDEEQDHGSPAQTGPGTGAGMGTEEGSGWAPQGDRFGEGGGEPSDEDDTPEHTHPE